MPNFRSFIPQFKRLLKVVLTLVLIILLTSWATVVYFKHDLQKTLGEEKLNTIIGDIHSAPSLPQDFKDKYSKIYPGVFSTSYIRSMINGFGAKSGHPCECATIANHILHSSKSSRIRRHLEKLAFVQLLEGEISQEKCFEYRAARYDFLNNAVGIHEATITYFDKPLDSLNTEEQLGLILKLQNASLYNERTRPEMYREGIEKLKAKLDEL